MLASVIACERTKAAIAEQRKFIAENAPRWPDMNTKAGKCVVWAALLRHIAGLGRDVREYYSIDREAPDRFARIKNV